LDLRQWKKTRLNLHWVNVKSSHKGIIINISVVIPTYNRYTFLKRSIQSVLSQSYGAKQIIVVDDGSTDQTSNIKNDFSNITYLYQKNSGVSSARNLGIKHAKYEWIAFLDSDDLWNKDKLQHQVQLHQNHENILMSYTDEVWIRDQKEIKIPKKFKKYGGEIFEKCLSHCIIAPSSAILHRSLFEEFGGFDENLEVCEDYDLWLKIASKYTIGLVDLALIIKHAGHEDQLSFKHWGMDRFRVQALENLQESVSGSKQVVLKQELIKKYNLLLKGAIKYDRIPQIKIYEKRLKELNNESN